MIYRTVTLEELYPDPTTHNPQFLYVYSVTNNPDGAGKGTYAKMLGHAERYTEAADIWEAAVAVAQAIYGPSGDAEIGLCVFEPEEEEEEEDQ